MSRKQRLTNLWSARTLTLFSFDSGGYHKMGSPPPVLKVGPNIASYRREKLKSFDGSVLGVEKRVA